MEWKEGYSLEGYRLPWGAMRQCPITFNQEQERNKGSADSLTFLCFPFLQSGSPGP